MFLSFFETKGHLRLPSFSLIPRNDASLLLINSGMAPMKPWFTGDHEPPSRRVCTSQKCIRTGDIDNIGKTDRHGTYFEMLGNFSFGDYFKHEAIAWCWEFLTSPDWVGLDPEKLYPSVYLEDDEAFNIWRDEIGIAPERISRLGKEDNFWEHGAGPCGPCSEVYFDRGPEHGCGRPDCAVGCDCDRFLEVWNNVFSQFNNDGHNNYTELKQKNIDTGMGLERLACVCQGVNSLFDVDTVMSITHRVSEITGAEYGLSHKTDVSLRVITDHIRSATFMIGDGVLPSNEGRGYVLRRLIRRASRHGKLLGVNEPFVYNICETVICENAAAYPDLSEKQAYITRVIKTEEENFARTIDGGMKILFEIIGGLKTAGSSIFSGSDAFRLYDTFGFPVELTKEIAADEGMTVDEEEFSKLMEQQRERARSARLALGDLAWSGIDLGLDATPTEFVGYTLPSTDATIIALVADGEVCASLNAGKKGIIILDRTPFYAEMGGQTADRGTIMSDKAVFEVENVQRDKGGKYLHHGVLRSGELLAETPVTAAIDVSYRSAIMRAHSATHLLHAALREVLGDHVHQAGSLVEADRLRFDFTHFAAMTQEETAKVADRVVDMILKGEDIDIREMSIDRAKSLGAMALFGEKYGDIVRVVKMGEDSLEFCGGTHADNTAKIGPFRIVSESSIASGVRRIEAVTGKIYMKLSENENDTLSKTAEVLKTSTKELTQRANSLMGEIRELQQALEKMKDRQFSGDAALLLSESKTMGELRVITSVRRDLDPADLRRIGDLLRDRATEIAAVLAAVDSNQQKITFLAVCGKTAVSKGISAGEIVKRVSLICGGSGGGKPESAMGGGKDISKLDEALAAVNIFIADKLSLKEEPSND